ncbi:MAG: DUF2911 domain-containing protein [Chthoniobacterales bacterium]
MNLSSPLSPTVRAAVITALSSTFALSSTLLAADEKPMFPDASQHASITQRVGLTDVSIEYSRPDKRGREIFGGLVPYGQVWRTGANSPTKIKFSEPVKIEGKEVAAGEYAFYTLPNENEWTIILSKNLKLWGAYGYKPDADELRVQVKPIVLPKTVETFTIGFDDLKDDRATISLEWDKTRVPVELTTDTMAQVSKNIATAMEKPESVKPTFYYQAAGFYYDHDKDLEQAAKWVDQAIAKQDPPRYFMYYKKAQIEAKLGHKAEAKAAAEKSIELIKAGENPDASAIRNSQLLIDGLR